MKRACTALFLFPVLIFCTSAMAATPLGGLSVALAPSGKILVAGGDNRVLYVLDAAKMEVTNRVWLGVSIVDLQFNKDGGTLLAEDTDGALHLMDAKTWKVVKQEPKSSLMSAARNADLVAALNPDSNGHIIRILSMTDLSEKGRVTLAKGQKVVALGLDAAAGRLGVLMDSVQDASEPKGVQPPTDLKGIALEEFRLKNDGKTSLFMVFAVPKGDKLTEKTLYYSPSSTGAKLFFQGDAAIVANYSNLNAKIAPSGEVSLFQLDNSFNYGLGVSPDQKVLMSGGLSEGTYTKVEGPAKTKFNPDRLPTWPEYFKAFAVGADGTAYGSTSAWRIMVIKPGGAFDKSYPVF